MYSKQPKMLRSLLVSLVVLCSLCVALTRSQPLGSGDSSDEAIADLVEATQPDQDSLPPDTFRKLAQALYQRGDKAENRLQRKFFYNDNVTCNDGSVAGFYIRRNYQSKRWIIFLEGGWICHDERSCMDRASREHHRMSSDRWPAVKTVGGILSADPEENPHFADANHVFVPYCSSDSWSGTQKKTKNGPAFLGHYIIREVVRELADFEHLLFHDELYLVGSSAGGTGVLVNIDSIAEIVRPAGLQVRGIVDSGWFLDNDPFSKDCADIRGGKCSVISDVQQGVKLWRARVPKTCAEAYPGEIWQCYFGYKIFPTIKTPLFIFQWQFDKFQLYADNVQVPASPDQWNYIHKLGSNLRNTFQNVSAVFSPSCIAHEVITKSHWSSIAVNEVTLPDAIACWAESLPSELSEDFAKGKSNFGHHGLEIRAQVSEKFLEDNNEIVVSQPYYNRRRSSSMFSDAPVRYKSNSNLVRSIPSPSMSKENSRNSLSSHLGRHKHQRARSGKFRDNRIRPSSRHDRNRRRQRRRNRKRCQLDPSECKDADKNSSNKADNNSKKKKKDNIDLVRSLDRRSSVKEAKERSKRREKEKKKKRRERKLRRRERKREKKRQKRLRKARREERKRQRLAAALKAEEEEKGLRQKRHLRVRSVVEESKTKPSSGSGAKKCRAATKDITSATSAGNHQYIDSCSWPHCNPTCPKLKNPETGQEIDFLSLLKSFGMDLSSVAKAMGVDINTLNNMDRDIIFHKLTSQQTSD